MLRITGCLLLTLLTAFTFAYPENPPVAHTGGFGEPTCHTCHFGSDLNDGHAALSLMGIGDRYVPGQRYTFNISIKRADMMLAGFQLSARDSLGRQAGRLEVLDGRAAIDTANAIQYVRHTPEGTQLVDDNTAHWRITWQAPASMHNVYLHLAVNAANGDASEFGDAVYLMSRVVKADQ